MPARMPANNIAVRAAFDIFEGPSAMQKWGRLMGQFQKDISNVTAKAQKTGLFSDTHLRKIRDSLQGSANEVRDTYSKIFKLSGGLSKKTLSAEEKAHKRMALEKAREELKNLKERFKLETDHILSTEKRRAKLQKIMQGLGAGAKKAAKFGKSLGSKAYGGDMKGMADKLGGAFSSVIKKTGKGVSKMGVSLAKKGSGAGGVMGGVMKKVGQLLKTFGLMISFVGAIAGGLAAVLKVMIDADAAAKEMNRSLMQSSVTVGDLGAGLGDVADKMGEVRKAFTDFGNNYAWGTLAQDHIEIIGSMNQAGNTFKEMTRGIEDADARMEKLRQTTSTVLTYAKLLGTSTAEVGSQMATYMEELGMSLEEVRKRFAGIYKAASTSGFATKRFYSMILQATSGMSMYNVRLDEAAGLLIRLGKILGEKAGGDFLQSLTKGFGDKSMTERYKQVMMTGSKKMQGIFQRSAENTADDFLSKVAGTDGGQAILDALSAKGIQINQEALEQGAKPELREKETAKLVAGLKKLSPEEQGRLLVMAQKDGNEALVRQLENLMNVSKGAKGGTGNMAMEMGSLDMGGKLAAQLSAVSAVISAPIHEMSIQQLMATEQMAGYSGQQLEEFRRVSKRLHSQYDIAKEQLKYAKATPEERAKMEAKGFKKMSRDDLLEKTGMVIGPDGLRTATKDEKTGAITEGRTVGSVNELIQASGSELKDAFEKGMDDQTKLAMEIARNTTDITKVLQQGVQWFLEKIYGLMQIFSTFFGDESMNEDEKAAKTAIIEGAKAKAVEARDERDRIMGEMTGVQQTAQYGKTDKDKEDAQAKLDVMREALKRLDYTIEAYSGMADSAAGIRKGADISDLWVDYDEKDYSKMAKNSPQLERVMEQAFKRYIGEGRLDEMAEEKFSPVRAATEERMKGMPRTVEKEILSSAGREKYATVQEANPAYSAAQRTLDQGPGAARRSVLFGAAGMGAEGGFGMAPEKAMTPADIAKGVEDGSIEPLTEEGLAAQHERDAQRARSEKASWFRKESAVHKVLMTKGNPEAIRKEMEKMKEQEKVEALARLLSAAGFGGSDADRQRIAQGMRSGDNMGSYNAQLKETRNTVRGSMSSAQYITEYGGPAGIGLLGPNPVGLLGGDTQDFISRGNGESFRFSANDTVIGAQSGMTFDKLLGKRSGGNQNVVVYANNAREVVKVLGDAQRAGLV